VPHDCSVLPTGVCKACPELPADVWTLIIAQFVNIHGLRAAKMLRKFARVSHIWWWHACTHEDNRIPKVRLMFAFDGQSDVQYAYWQQLE
jgi:hypothetical protein